MPVLDDLAMLLQTQLGVSPLLGAEPDATIDPAVTLYEYAGEPGEYSQDSIRPFFETARIEVGVRSRDYQTARLAMQPIYELLDLVNTWIGPVFYSLIRPLSPPYALPLPDVNNRRTIALRLRVQRRN